MNQLNIYKLLIKKMEKKGNFFIKFMSQLYKLQERRVDL